MIVYISRGLLSSLSEARDVLDAISVENALVGHRVVINTYAVIDGELRGVELDSRDPLLALCVLGFLSKAGP